MSRVDEAAAPTATSAGLPCAASARRMDAWMDGWMDAERSESGRHAEDSTSASTSTRSTGCTARLARAMDGSKAHRLARPGRGAVGAGRRMRRCCVSELRTVALLACGIHDHPPHIIDGLLGGPLVRASGGQRRAVCDVVTR